MSDPRPKLGIEATGMADSLRRAARAAERIGETTFWSVLRWSLNAAFYFTNLVGAVVVIGEALSWWDLL